MRAADRQDRAYLDWNASAPLAPEAQAAILAALDQVGNPSSQHAEGRAARRLVEEARDAVAALIGASDRSEIVFTSGATEAIATAVLGAADGRPAWATIDVSRGEHAAVAAAASAAEASGAHVSWRRLGPGGGLGATERPEDAMAMFEGAEPRLRCRSAGNSETGIVDLESIDDPDHRSTMLIDATQGVARPARRADDGALERVDLGRLSGSFAAISAHKIGGPRGVGALYVAQREPAPILIPGGGQELWRRSGTENVAAIAGFGAAARALLENPPDWSAVEQMRDAVERAVADAAPDATFFRPASGDAGLARLINTSLFATPDWPAETQLMQLDLAGVAVSAGSACSSGKLSASPVLLAMGVDPALAACAIRVSLGPTTTEDQIDRFLSAWTRALSRRRGS